MTKFDELCAKLKLFTPLDAQITVGSDLSPAGPSQPMSASTGTSFPAVLSLLGGPEGMAVHIYLLTTRLTLS